MESMFSKSVVITVMAFAFLLLIKKDQMFLIEMGNERVFVFLIKRGKTLPIEMGSEMCACVPD